MQITMRKGGKTLVIKEVGDSGMVRAEVSYTTPSGQTKTKPTDYPRTAFKDVVQRYRNEGWQEELGQGETWLGDTDFVWF